MRLAYTAEPTLGHTERERDTDLSTKRGQLRYLVDQLGVTRAQANNLIRAYVLDQRDADAHKASREEFRAWFQRRGDLLMVRGKAQMPWRVTS